MFKFPPRLARARAGGSDFFLGHYPFYSLSANGRALVNVDLSNQNSALGNYYDCAITRVDAEVGIDMVPTLTIYLTGDEAGLLVNEQLARGTEVKLEVGHDLLEDYSLEENQLRTIYKGETTIAIPATSFPSRIQLEADGFSWRMRKSYQDVPTEASQAADFILARLSEKGVDLKANFLSETPQTSGEDISTEGDTNLLDYIMNFTQENGLHWMDNGDENIYFFYPSDRPEYMGQKHLNWAFTMRGEVGSPYAPVMTVFDPQVDYIDTPGQVQAIWRKPFEKTLEPELITVEIPGGDPEKTYQYREIVSEDREEVVKLLENLASDKLWKSVKGNFEIEAPVPIMPLDDFSVSDLPAGLEEFSDYGYRVISAHHIFDERGGIVRGMFRAIVE